MGTPFTSARSGLWDASDVDTWGQGAGVYPQTAGDVWTVAAGHTVTYNKVSTVELGLGTINGLLTFLNSMSTKLTMNHNNIAIANGGELRIGSSGAGIIPKAYTAELIFNTTSDWAKGIAIANGGKLTVYGDPDYFGSDYDAVLAASSGAIPTAGNAVTITVTGDFTTKWVIGQELLVHKGGAYASYINDFCRLAITGLAVNGADTDVACTVTERPAALTCLLGADVLNLSRNVMIYKYGFNANLGQANTNRPIVSNANAGLNSNYNVYDAVFAGFAGPIIGTNPVFDGVIRNGTNALQAAIIGQVSGILTSCGACINTSRYNTINCTICACPSNVITDSHYSIFTGDLFGNANTLYQFSNCIFTGNIYSCGNAILSAPDAFITGRIGYDKNDVAKPNGIDVTFGTYLNFCRIVNAKIATPIFGSRNYLGFGGRVGFEHYQQVVGTHYIADAYGDISKLAVGASGTPTPPTANPPSGVTNVLDVQNVQSNCPNASPNYLKIFDLRVWAAAGVSKTYKFYVQWVSPTSHTLTAAELILSGEYLDNSPAGSGHLATATPSAETIAVRTGTTDWAKYVSITMNPAVDGWVNLKLTLKYYESGAMALFVDPVVNIT